MSYDDEVREALGKAATDQRVNLMEVGDAIEDGTGKFGGKFIRLELVSCLPTGPLFRGVVESQP